MTYIGYGLITTASEEVIEPEKTIPKAILISIAAVIVIKTSVFFIGCGILPWQQLVPEVTSTPMIDTAAQIGGAVGGYLFAFAGILATLSSINTAVMASSRTSFAMARDQRLPSLFKAINRSTKTPVFSIVVSSIIVFIAVSIRDLEHISTVTSIFSLTGYSLVNVALIVNLAVSDRPALIIAVSVIGAGVLYYYLIMPKLKYASKGISIVDVPEIKEQKKENRKNEIIIPVANPNTAEGLLNFGRTIALSEESTTVVPVKVNVFPDNLLTIADYDVMMQSMGVQDSVVQMLKEYEAEPCMRPVLINSRDAFHAIMSVVKKEKNPLVIMGWHGSGLAKYMHGNITYRMLQEAPADVGVLRIHDQQQTFQNILFPYGGGKYSKMTAKVVNRIANAYGARITLLNVVDHEEDVEDTRVYLDKSAAKFDQPTEIKVCSGDLIERVVAYSKQYDLIIMGASLDWGIQEVVTGFRTDKIMEQAACSVLIIKSYDIFLQRTKVRGLIHKTRKAIHQ